MSGSSSPALNRVASLDQFRGYTMFGMLLVNFLGGFAALPPVFKHHHDYCSYADTIMPQFLFSAGFAMRLSLGKRLAAGGKMPWGRLCRRILGLILVSVVWYSICDWNGIISRLQSESFLNVLGWQLKRGWFQTLMHIAITSLWIVPVISCRIPVRLAYAAASVALHVVLSWAFNFHWVNTPPNGIDGGPLGFLTWTVPAICGTIAADWVQKLGLLATRPLLLWGLVLGSAAWGLSNLSMLYNVASEVSPSSEPAQVSVLADDPVVPRQERWERWNGELIEPPFVPPPPASQRQWNYWMMSQRGGTLTYTTFAAGLSMILFAGFLKVADGWKWEVGIFRTLGRNSLAAYILHDIVGWIFDPVFPGKTSSFGMMIVAFVTMFLAVWIPCRIMEAKGWFLRV